MVSSRASWTSAERNQERLLTAQLPLLELIAIGRPLDECLLAVTAAVTGLLSGTRSAVLVTNETRAIIERVYSSSMDSSFANALRGAKITDPPVGSCGAAIYRGESIECKDVLTDDRMPSEWRDVCIAHVIRTCFSTPITNNRGQTIGSFPLFFSDLHETTHWERRIAEFGARIAGIAIARDRSARALRESEERFRAFVATSSDMMYRMSPDWSEMRFLDGRDFIENTTAPSHEWVSQYIDPADEARVFAAINIAIADKTAFDLEHRVNRPNGSVGWVHSRAIPILDEHGAIIEWFGAATDITERKRVEERQREALRESERVIDALQKAFVPQSLPETAQLELDAAYFAAGGDTPIGGDWYDAFPLAQHRIAISVGDVTGHGLSAAVIAAKLRQAVSVCALTADEDPSAVLRSLNRVLRLQHPEVYATAIIAVIDTERHELRYASAGHPPVLIAPGDKTPVRRLEFGDLPLGVEEHLEVTTRTVALSDQAVLAFHSDGLLEFARDLDSAERALTSALESVCSSEWLSECAREVVQTVLHGEQPSDDIVLLLARFSATRRRSESPQLASSGDTWRFHSDDDRVAHALRRHVTAFAQRAGMDDDAVFKLQMVLGETLANVVQHAPGMAEVSLRKAGASIALTVTDNGPGFDGAVASLPHELLDESGRGLFLIKALAEDVSIGEAPGGGTTIRVVVPITGTSAESMKGKVMAWQL